MHVTYQIYLRRSHILTFPHLIEAILAILTYMYFIMGSTNVYTISRHSIIVMSVMDNQYSFSGLGNFPWASYCSGYADANVFVLAAKKCSD